MKSENEIRAKIAELMEKAAAASETVASMGKTKTMLEEHEALCNNIDALLWVIDDESGKPI